MSSNRKRCENWDKNFIKQFKGMSIKGANDYLKDADTLDYSLNPQSIAKMEYDYQKSNELDTIARGIHSHTRKERCVPPKVQKLTPVESIEQAMAKNLYEWGIDPNADTCTPKHRNFFEHAISTAIAEYNGTRAHKHSDSNKCEEINPIKLPLVKPIEFVLLYDIASSRRTYYRIVDAIADKYGENLGYAPFDVDLDFTGNFRTYLRPEYTNVPSKLVKDPFVRFSDVELNKRDYFQWFYFNSNESFLKGIIFEALVGSHLTNNSTACASCLSVNSFRWNGGYGTSWKDMLCINCGSTYEIKSKQSVQHIGKAIKYNRINGGSFFHFHQLRRELANKMPRFRARQFLVLVSRTVTSPLIKGKVAKGWQVDLVEIETVMPRLNERCFIKGLNHINLSSYIMVKRETRQIQWAQIPFYKFDGKRIAREVFNAHFCGRESINDKSPGKRTKPRTKSCRNMKSKDNNDDTAGDGESSLHNLDITGLSLKQKFKLVEKEEVDELVEEKIKLAQKFAKDANEAKAKQLQKKKHVASKKKLNKAKSLHEKERAAWQKQLNSDWNCPNWNDLNHSNPENSHSKKHGQK